MISKAITILLLLCAVFCTISSKKLLADNEALQQRVLFALDASQLKYGAELGAAGGKYVVNFANMGKGRPISVFPRNDLRQFTGVVGPVVSGAGLHTQWPGSHGVVTTSNNEVGLNLHSESIPTDDNYGLNGWKAYNLCTLTLEGNISPVRPFQLGSTLFMKVVAKIPYAVHSAPGMVTQAVVYFNFGDVTTGIHFWYGVVIYDNRGYANAVGTQSGYQISYDAGTASPNVLSTLGKTSPFVQTVSGTFSSQPWSEYRTLSFSIQPAQLINAVREVKKRYPGEARVQQLSEDANNYSLGHANVNPEIYSPRPLDKSMFAHMGMSIQEFSYYVQ